MYRPHFCCCCQLSCIPPRLSVSYSGVELNRSTNYDFIIFPRWTDGWIDGKDRVKGREFFLNSLFSIRGHVLCELQTSQQLYETLAESATSHNNHGGR